MKTKSEIHFIILILFIIIWMINNHSRILSIPMTLFAIIVIRDIIVESFFDKVTETEETTTETTIDEQGNRIVTITKTITKTDEL